MESEINTKFLENTSLNELIELKKFYEDTKKISDYPGLFDGQRVEVDTTLLEERLHLINVAIKRKKCILDARLFGSSIMLDPEKYINEETTGLTL